MLNIAIIGVGNRGRIYGNNLKKIKGVNIVSLCELNSAIMLDMARKWKVDESKCFCDENEFFAQGKIADALVISTQDRDHARHALMALELGYNLLLEKPMSPILDECLEIQRVAKEKNLKVVVCHVMRYTPFYNALRNTVRDGTIGDIIDINHTENVGYWHFSHSYVRGNWRRNEESSPSILAKCCHDFDEIYWLTNQMATEITSNGQLNHFRKENKPLGSPEYCLDGCKYEKSCPFHVSKIYFKITPYTIPKMIINAKLITQDPKPTLSKIKQVLKKGPYGRCVYSCDNDVVDQHNTLLKLSGGTTVKLSMTAFSKDCYRKIHIYGTKGEIIANDTDGKFRVNLFGGKSYIVRAGAKELNGHLGGDFGIIKDFISVLLNEKTSDNITYIDDSIESHRNALAAEQSRLTGETIKF